MTKALIIVFKLIFLLLNGYIIYRTLNSYKNYKTGSSFWALFILIQTFIIQFFTLPIHINLPKHNFYLLMRIVGIMYSISIPFFTFNILEFKHKSNNFFIYLFIVNFVYICTTFTLPGQSQFLKTITPIFNITFIIIRIAAQVYLILLLFLRKNKRETSKMRLLILGILIYQIAGQILSIYYRGNYYIYYFEFYNIFNITAFIYSKELYTLFTFFSIYKNSKKEHLPPIVYKASICKSLKLSPREEDVVNLLFNEFSSKDIANKLSISKSTVNSHIYKIYKKLNIKNRRELFNIIEKKT